MTDPLAGQPADGCLRIGDAERQQAVHLLSEHLIAGRLTANEYDERSPAAASARTAEPIGMASAGPEPDRAARPAG